MEPKTIEELNLDEARAKAARAAATLVIVAIESEIESAVAAHEVRGAQYAVECADRDLRLAEARAELRPCEGAVNAARDAISVYYSSAEIARRATVSL
jgi:hypothetical protein